MGICRNVGSAKRGKTFLFPTIKNFSSRDRIWNLSDNQMSSLRKKQIKVLYVFKWNNDDISTISVDFLPMSLLLTSNMYCYWCNIFISDFERVIIAHCSDICWMFLGTSKKRRKKHWLLPVCGWGRFCLVVSIVNY